MRKMLLLAILLVCVAPVGAAETQEQFLPAGTLLQCTIDEPNFSSRTVHVEDPILCHVSPVGMFGRPIFPRGAYLSGRFADYRDPGHFFGKGWLALNFNSLALPSGTLPVATKVVSVPHYRVDADGKIHGRGHPRRDAIEWAIPVLWPLKIMTLPARGPHPTLKGETRITLRLMDDVYIPAAGTTAPSAAVLVPRSSERIPTSENGTRARLWYGGTSVPAAEAELPLAAYQSAPMQAMAGGASRQMEGQRPAPKSTLLMLKNGRAHFVTDYWVKGEDLVVYPGSDGKLEAIPLDQLDLPMTLQLNRERGVPLVFRSKPDEP